MAKVIAKKANVLPVDVSRATQVKLIRDFNRVVAEHGLAGKLHCRKLPDGTIICGPPRASRVALRDFA